MEEPKQEPSERDQNMADKMDDLRARIKEQETQINQMKTLIENGNVQKLEILKTALSKAPEYVVNVLKERFLSPINAILPGYKLDIVIISKSKL